MALSNPTSHYRMFYFPTKKVQKDITKQAFYSLVNYQRKPQIPNRILAMDMNALLLLTYRQAFSVFFHVYYYM